VRLLIPIKVARGAGRHSAVLNLEFKMITPFLALVLAGYALFMAVLGVVWVRSYVADLLAARVRAR